MQSTSLTGNRIPVYTHAQMLEIVATVVESLMHPGEPEALPVNLENGILQQSELPDAGRQTLTVSEAAVILGVSRPTVYKMVSEGSLPAFHMGKRVLIDRNILNDWVRNGGQHV